VGADPAAGLGEHPHRVRAGHLGDVDDLVAVEHDTENDGSFASLPGQLLRMMGTITMPRMTTADAVVAILLD
jgi:hypothetical protein